MTLFCISCIAATLSSGVTSAPLKDLAGVVIVPFENSISRIGNGLTTMRQSFQDKQDLIRENDELREQIDILTTQNGKLIADQSELVRL